MKNTRYYSYYFSKNPLRRDLDRVYSVMLYPVIITYAVLKNCINRIFCIFGYNSIDRYKYSYRAVYVLAGRVGEKNPDNIACYNTMSADKKKNVDIGGLSSMVNRWLRISGIILIGGNIALPFIDDMTVASAFMPVAIVIPVLIIVIKAPKYNYNRRRSRRK